MRLSDFVEHLKNSCPSFNGRVGYFIAPSENKDDKNALAKLIETYSITKYPYMIVSKGSCESSECELIGAFSQISVQSFIVGVLVKNNKNNQTDTLLDMDDLIEGELKNALLGFKFDSQHHPMQHISDESFYVGGIYINFSMWAVKYERRKECQ